MFLNILMLMNQCYAYNSYLITHSNNSTMKNFLPLLLCILFMASCHKDATPPPSSTQHTSTTLTTDEQAIAADWHTREITDYDAAGNITSSNSVFDSVNCHMNLQSSQSSANASYSLHDAIYAMSCSSVTTGWSRTGSYLTIVNQQYYIMRVTADSLVLKFNSGPIYYITKLTR